MKTIGFLTSPPREIPIQLRSINSHYAVKTLKVTSLLPGDLKTLGYLIVDLNGLPSSSFDRVRKLLQAHPHLQSGGLVNTFKRQDMVQAKAMGLSSIWDLETEVEPVLAEINRIVGGYCLPVLKDNVRPKTGAAILNSCAVYERLIAACISGRPVPLKESGEAVNSVIGALKEDGLPHWLEAVQAHHSQTMAHSLSVTGYVLAFSEHLKLSLSQSLMIGVGALYHDLGKIKIPLDILDKPGKLTDEEWSRVRRHPEFGQMILERHPEVPPVVRDMVVSHHEFLDGSGYPNGLGGDKLSKPVRLLTICDMFSALLERGVHTSPMSERQAFGVLWDMEGKLDRPMLKAFRKIVLQSEFGAVRPKALNAIAV